METRSFLTGIAVAVGLGAAATAGSQPATNQPKIVVGDQWEWTKTVMPSGATEKVSYAVVEIVGDDRLKARTHIGTIIEFDGALQWLPQGNPDYRQVLVAFPMAVGKEWPVARKFPSPTAAETGTARVMAYEPITVPAGKLQCYRIEATARMEDKGYTETRTWKRWYCPAVKAIGKEVLETRYFHPNNPAASNPTGQTLELVKFTPGK